MLKEAYIINVLQLIIIEQVLKSILIAYKNRHNLKFDNKKFINTKKLFLLFF